MSRRDEKFAMVLSVDECGVSVSEMERTTTSTTRRPPPVINWFPPSTSTPYLRQPASTPAKAGLTPREAALVKDIVMFEEDDSQREDEDDDDVCAVSYTHLTLPTKRIV